MALAPKKPARKKCPVSNKDLTKPNLSGKISVQFRQHSVLFELVFNSAFGSEHVPFVLVHSVVSQFVGGGKGSVAYSALERFPVEVFSSC